LQFRQTLIAEGIEIMNRQLLRTLVIASFATIACNASAENATPRELPSATPAPGAQNGSPAEAPPATAYPSTTNAYPSNSPGMRGRMTEQQIREYMDARQACNSRPTPQLESCTNDVNSKFSSVDAKCQKLSGPALADCLKGADHGG